MVHVNNMVEKCNELEKSMKHVQSAQVGLDERLAKNMTYKKHLFKYDGTM
jgi:hypothetical protein